MTNLLCADLFETLNLDWRNILLYFVAFAVLFVGLTFLLFKPVKKFMDKRQKEIADEIGEADRIKYETEQRMAEEERKMQEVTEEVKRKASEMEAEKIIAAEERENLLAKARKEADDIRLAAKIDADKEREKAVLGAKEDVAELAVMMAKSILEREITPQDDEKLIGECLKEWKKND